jgi:hypothetical protein
LRRLVEEPQGSQSFPVDPLGLEGRDEIPGQRLDLTGPAFFQEQDRHLEPGEEHVVPHLARGEFPPRLFQECPSLLAVAPPCGETPLQPDQATQEDLVTEPKGDLVNLLCEIRRFGAAIHVAEHDGQIESLLVPEARLGLAIDPGARLRRRE